MRFLVDAQLPPGLAVWLRERGHEAHAVRELGLRDAEDDEIWAHALRIGAVMVTKDLDFVLLAAMEPATQVLWIRTGNTSNPNLLARLGSVWENMLDHILSGSRIIELY
jgi:predicted nuclease of predicted toxin-antitoxin system